MIQIKAICGNLITVLNCNSAGLLNVAEPQPGELVNLLQCFPEFILDIVVHSAPEDLQYLGAMATARRENKRKVELFGVTPVEVLKFFKFVVAAIVKASARLLVSRGIGHVTSSGQAPRKIRVSAKQRQLRLAACCFDHVDEGAAKTCCGVVPQHKAGVPDLHCNPGRMFVYVTNISDNFVAIHLAWTVIRK